MTEFSELSALLESATVSLQQSLSLEAIAREFEALPPADRLEAFRLLLEDWQRKQNMLMAVIARDLGAHFPR